MPAPVVAAASAGLPEPFVNGSVTYLVLTLIAMAIGIFARISGKVDKENASIFILFSGMTGVCLWMFWACCWLHQWHVLIYPTYINE
ncbi:small cysteine rich protein SCR76 [Achlya hypogyna]|uniref:Small cysteine rich protein SCR76 n=1 Tax=Achlya hypogyna TaxID=1202772 RepID=A0A1V9YU43_ACHHY|nr:small cysteine rich protein SCR76 [Achlya hypogyna]